MKDSYSFDRDEAGLGRSFRGASRRLRPDLPALRARGVRRPGRVRDDGRQRVDRLPRAVGLRREHARHVRERRLRGRPRDRARRSRARRSSRSRLDAPEEVETPGTTTIEALAELLGDRPGRDVEGDAGHARTTARSCSRSSAATTGSRRRSSRAALGADFRPATEEEIRAGFGADGGSLGPVGFAGEIVADEALREGQFVAGANRTGWHLRGVEAGRDFEPRFADIRQPKEGDACPVCGGALRLPDGDRGRPHLQARHARTRSRSARRSWTRTASRSRS